ncbi:hypothetical protein FF38_14229 [Lucilia cuprina]|uniref:Uncharacterized protein n=1 Tax=Lucilia cuprina TaxID=7375 RepID=A0A0L0BS27_LUCCU|nr:hypothetical protein FF38_14229 [Lucilia cuprina]
MFIENFFYNETIKTIPTTGKSAITPKCENFVKTLFNKCLKCAGEHLVTVVHITLLFVLGLTLLLMDLLNASVNHLVNVVPVTLVQSPRGIDDMLAAENVPAEITLGAINNWTAQKYWVGYLKTFLQSSSSHA